MDFIYLDNNATTQPADEVVVAMDKANRTLWANPSSMHRLGQQARQQIELAREQVAKLISAKASQIIFTSGGTESNNLAIKGILEPTLYRSAPASGVLITTKIEHAAVVQPAQEFSQAGGEVVYLPVDGQGVIKPKDITENILALCSKEDRSDQAPLAVILISVQWANNETGVIQPIGEIGEAIEQARKKLADGYEENGGRDARPTGFGSERNARPTDARPTGNLNGRPAIYFHVDATQAVGKIPVDVSEVDIDLMTFSAHKFHGPKGAGALYVRPGIKLQSVNSGGPQEREKRGGTENSAGIIGLGAAAKLANEFLTDTAQIKQLKQMRDEFERTIINVQKMAGGTPALPDCASVNCAGALRLWNTSNMTFAGLDSEAILLSLSERGVCASAGAACSSGSLEPSPVLMAMGMSESAAQSSVRFSISRYTTKQDLERAADLIVETVKKLS